MTTEAAGQGPVDRVVRPGAEARRLAEAIDPLRREKAPDHLTLGCAARLLEEQDAEIKRLRSVSETYKWAYEYLQGRMHSIDRHGWAEDCDGEITHRIAGPN